MDEISLSNLLQRSSMDQLTTVEPPTNNSAEDRLLADEDARKVSWLSLFAFTNRQHLLVFAAALLLSVISGLVFPGMSILLGKVFAAFAGFGSDKLGSKEFMDEVTKFTVYLSLLGCGSWAFNGAFFASWLWFGELQAKAAREKLFDSLIEKELGWFEQRKDGVAAMISKSQTQIKELQMSVSQPLGYSIQSLATAFGSLGVALYHCWSLTLVILATLPVALALVSFLSKQTQSHIARQKGYLESASKTASCAITSIETVKAFNGQAREHVAFTRATKAAAEEHKQQASLNAIQMGIIRLFTFSLFVQGFWYGSTLVRGGDGLTAADIMTTFWSCLMATQALELIISQMVLLEKGRAAGAGLKALLARMEKRGCGRHRLGGHMPVTCRGDIEIKGVSFIYPSRPSELALSDVDLRLPANKTTFIVGRSGSGKSTLGSLIINAYRPLCGDISIDNHSVKALDPRWIRENVSLIPQESTLFNETIFRNVSFGKKDYDVVTREEVQEVCKLFALEKTISELPRGLGTVVGVGGKQLSGGQLQRVALARDRLRDATVLILDEALSMLDVSTRRTVAAAIRCWRRGKTTVIITHDISEIARDDFAYVMEGGKIVQEGYRRDLESRAGPFQLFLTAAGNARERWRRHFSRQNSSPLIPEFGGDFQNGGIPDLGLQTINEPSPFSDEGMEFTQPRGFSDHDKVFSLVSTPRTGVVRARRSSEATTLPELSSFSPPSQVSSHSSGSNTITWSNSAMILPSRNHSNVQMGFNTGEETPPRGPNLSEQEPMLPQGNISYAQGNKASLLRISATVWPSLNTKQRLLLVLGFVAALFYAAATPVFAYALAHLLQSVLDTRISESEAQKWSLSILGVAVVDGVNCYLMYYLLETSAQRWVDHHRLSAFSRILDQPRVWFFSDKNSVSRLIDDLEKHVEEMRNLVARYAGYGFIGFSLTAIGTTWSVMSCWRLTLVGLCVVPIMYGIWRAMGCSSDWYESRCNDAAQNTGSILLETITSIRAVRNYNVERFFRNKYFASTQTGLRIGIQRSVFAGFWFGLGDSTILFATALIFYYGAILIGNAQEDLQSVLSVFTLLLFSLATVNSIIGMIPQVSSSKDSTLRVLRLSHLPLTSHEHTGTLTPPATIPSCVHFLNTTFSYPTRPHTTILHSLTFTIPAGSITAIVGASGTGKSTLVALLQRLYSPDSGEILIAGIPLSSLSTPRLREHIAVVPQSATIFDATIAENIGYGLYPAPSEAAVICAAERAGIHDFITTLPEGYHTRVGDASTGLSGGQAQRVAIARALVRQPRVLVLDECTSNLDSEGAKTVRESVLGLVQKAVGMTVVMVTHSPELMSAAERIVVIAGGRVVEEGGYEELAGRGGELCRLLEGL